MPRTIPTSRRARPAALSVLAAACVAAFVTPGSAAEGPSPRDFLDFIKAQAAARWSKIKPPTSRDQWVERSEAIRQALRDSWGGFPAETCPLEPKVLGTIRRDGYRVEKVVFQTRPGVWMTANAYVPDGGGKRPALLMVHGHWRGAKQDPVVQSRCIGAVKLGYFVLVVDAFGAGERGVGKVLGEYHGEMTGATLLPVGLPLSGLQVYENGRAVDYLHTRPELDPVRIGITGASGGGNQTMYAGGYDERFKGVVPVCSVGTYDSYLGAACCICELVPGIMRTTEEWGILSLVAPRGLMIVNATRDAHQFSVGEAKKSLAVVEPIYRLFDRPGQVKHAVFESGHDYSRPMREATYGWMALQLKGEGDGSSIAEPEIKTEDPESLRCYPGDTRPDDWMTIPRFAAREGKALLTARPPTRDTEVWREASERLRSGLVDKVFGGFPAAPPVEPKTETAGDGPTRLVRFESEPGITLVAKVEAGKSTMAPLAILLDLDGAEKASAGALAGAVRRAGWGLVTLDLRATGKLAWPSDAVGHAPDHNTAEWAMWIGRPLLGQWAFDVRRLLDALQKLDGGLPPKVVLLGNGPGGVVALCAGAVDPRVTAVAAVGSLASFVTDTPYAGQRLGILAPGILREVGDVAHLAMLNAPRRVVVAGGVAGNGKPLAAGPLRDAYRDAASVWGLLKAESALVILGGTEPAEVLGALR